MNSFFGGLQLDDHKLTSKKPIVKAAQPKKVYLPLQQSLGCPAVPIVKVGDEVAEGIKIADSDKELSAAIHASISGKVTEISRLPNACGFEVDSIVIEAREQPKSIEYISQWSVEEMTPEKISRIVKEAGIVGLGGAAFPTHVKLAAKVKTLIINGCECEPFITADHRLMLERAGDVVFGARALAKAVSAKQIIIAVENNKPDAIRSITSQLPTTNYKLVTLPTKYPQGGEKQLIKAVLGREVPSGGLPKDVDVLVQNVGTAVAVAEAVRYGKSLIERVVTVTGSGVKNPQNLLVRLGTTFMEVIDHCGGLTDDAAKVIMGGPMSGLAVSDLNIPVVKATNCILVLNRHEVKKYQEQACIRCGRCIKACPMGLMPNFLGDYAKLNDWEKTKEYHVADCIECGCCAYICPSRIDLVKYFKLAKTKLKTSKAVCK